MNWSFVAPYAVLAERKPVDPDADGRHRAADVGAEGQRQHLAEAALAFADQPVPRPAARRLHGDQHLARPRAPRPPPSPPPSPPPAPGTGRGISSSRMASIPPKP